MRAYVFPGFPAFLERACRDLEVLPSAVLAAGRIVPLTALANLCAQAADAPAEHVAGILKECQSFRDELAVSLNAAEAMLEEVERERLTRPPAGPTLVSSTAETGESGRAGVPPQETRKGSRIERAKI